MSSKTLLYLSLPVEQGKVHRGTGVNRGTGNVKRIRVAERSGAVQVGNRVQKKSQKNQNLSRKNTTPGQQKKSVPGAGSCTWGGGGPDDYRYLIKISYLCKNN